MIFKNCSWLFKVGLSTCNKKVKDIGTNGYHIESDEKMDIMTTVK